MEIIGDAKGARNRLEVCLSLQEVVYFRTGAFLRHPDSVLVIPQKTTLPISRLSQQLYFMFRVVGNDFVAATPYADAYLCELTLKPDEKLICKLGHVLGFSDSVVLKSKWKVDATSIFMKQCRYTYLLGPGRVFLFGIGEVHIEAISGTDLDFDSGAVVGWTSSVAVGASSRSSIGSALLGKEEVVLHRFSGQGSVITQASTSRKLPKRFNSDGKDRNFIDYVNAFLGLGI